MKFTMFAVIVAATQLLAQSNPAADAWAEQLRTQPLKGMPKVTVMAAIQPPYDVGVVQQRVVTRLNSTGISAKEIVGGRYDGLLMMVTLKIQESDHFDLFLAKISCLESGTIRRTGAIQNVEVWGDESFGIAAKNGGALTELILLIDKFVRDYLRANPELLPKVDQGVVK